MFRGAVPKLWSNNMSEKNELIWAGIQILLGLTALLICLAIAVTLIRRDCVCECKFKEPQTIFVEPDYE